MTNAGEAPYGYRQFLFEGDSELISTSVGGLQVYSTTELLADSYTPWANPFASKLFGLAYSAAENFIPDLIVGWYFEPYGIVAALLGRFLDVPVYLIHAGSDIGKLAHHPNLHAAYHVAASMADGLLTNNIPSILESVRVLGVPDSKIILSEYSALPSVYRSTAGGFDMDFLSAASAKWFEQYPVSVAMLSRLRAINLKSLKAGEFTICVYGKVGKAKASFEILDALNDVLQLGRRFNFITVPAGDPITLNAYFEHLFSNDNLVEHTWLLPPIAPWRIPQLLKLTDAAFSLEYPADIEFHASRIAREILASGTTLICSHESIDRNHLGKHLFDRINAVVVEPPRARGLHRRLIELIDNRDACTAIGRQGKRLSNFLEGFADGRMPLSQLADLLRK
ncbi:hypothetical protein [Sinorhizobium medicae]|uniref:hypothetical protein n=1 Tax=Sinorhizobium medicae TaxID=110321 RepID=UPI0005190FDD|nr:hypothetical protein [Sinorhizobium medicae]